VKGPRNEKRIFFYQLIIIVLFGNALCLAQTRTVIAVLDLSVSEDISASSTVALSNIVTNELIISGKYIVVDRRNVAQLVNEMEIQLSGLTTQESVVEVGKMLNAQKMVFGTIGKLGQKLIITLQLTDVTTGIIETSINQSYIGTTESLDNPVATITRQLIGIEPIPKKGTSIYITSEPKGAKIYVNETFRGNSPVNIPVEESGQYTIGASTSGYENWAQKVTVKKDETIFISAALAEVKGYRFIMRRDGPILLGAVSGIVAIVFRIRAGGFYEDQKTVENLEDFSRARDATKRNYNISYVLSGICLASAGFSVYEYLKRDEIEDLDSSLNFRTSFDN